MPKPNSPDGGTTFDLDAIETELRRESAYRKNGHAARSLVRVPDLRLVLVAMKAGSEIKEGSMSTSLTMVCNGGTSADPVYVVETESSLSEITLVL